jgi:hypothetical protein
VATHCFKRRTASRQAVSRKVEGIEPRKRRDGKGDAVLGAEVAMGIPVNGKGVSASPGSETMACLTLGLHGNPGGPALSPRQGSMPDNRRGRKANEVQGVGWPRNAAGGKGATHGSAA